MWSALACKILEFPEDKRYQRVRSANKKLQERLTGWCGSGEG